MISIVIPVKDGGEDLKRLLAAIEQQTVDEPIEVIVVDSGSTDGTQEAARSRGARVHQIAAHEFNHGGTRNVGAGLARGETLVFTVDDAEPIGSSWLAALVEPLRRDHAIAGSYSRQVPKEPVSAPLRYYLNHRYPDAPRVQAAPVARAMDPADILFSNVSSAMRRSVWEALPFATDMLTAEDLEWARRALLSGHRIAYTPASVVRHSHRYTLATIFKRYVDQGVASERTVLAGDVESRDLHETGISLVRRELGWMTRSGYARQIPYAVVYEATRFLGFSAGRRYRSLPRSLLRRWSLFPVYWTVEAERAREAPPSGS